jgi:DNA mismatch repair protein MutL
VSERPTIRVLPDDLANQIAAGEVVERPASVVKELVENALDAGAQRVDVAIEGGGLSLIQVADDGCGMSAGDAHLCLGRHATSKLALFSDLESIVSFGFRGEALPSIASVSRLSLRTRPSDEESGVLLRVEAGVIQEDAPIASPVGTTVNVLDLFFNVPARRKFLRSSNTESGHVGDVITDAALGRPDVAFSLLRDGRKVRNFVRVRSRRERVAQVFSGEELRLCQGERGPLSVEAYLSGPERGRQGASGLKIFVNGRPVRDRALAATIAHSYGGLLERGRYPRGVVYLKLPGRLVDVNVHPQKTEVRFADARAVADAIYSVLQKGLALSASVLEGGQTRPPQAAKAGKNVALPTARPHLLREHRPVSGSRYGSTGKVTSTAPIHSRVQSESKAASRAASKVEPKVDSRVAPQAGATWKGLRLLGVSRQRYLICEGDEGIYILDHHAVHERVLLTLLRRDFSSGGIPNQALLFPETVSLSPQEVDLVAASAQLLGRLGLDVRVRSPESASIHSIPKVLGRLGAQPLLRQVLSEFSSSKVDQRDGPFDGILARLACSEAIPSGETMGREMAESLLRSLASADFGATCQHERLVLSHLSSTELERKAGRDG